LEISTDWIRDFIAKGKDIGSIIGEAHRHGELEWEYERHQNKHMFMLQANIDIFRGIKTSTQINEEEEKIFAGLSGIWGYTGVKRVEKVERYDDWIRKNHDFLKMA
jgi:hypothetical protein